MEKNKQDITDIFVRHRKLTLGVKLVGTFAFTYYLLYFILLTVFGVYYRSVYDPAYSGETLFQTMLSSAILWSIVGMIVVSLILLFRKRRYGKFLFMVFTIILIGYQLVASENHIWAIYFIELMIVIVMAPLKVFVTINKTINKKIVEIEEIIDIKKEK